MEELARYRVLNACDACGRQYDVSHLDQGRRVSCACGARFGVRVQKPHDPRALKCSSCGGLLKDAARACEYCAAEITLEERRLSAVCPKCFARMAGDARFCMECGIAIAPQSIYALPDGSRCPRCKGTLQARSLGTTAVTECSACGGYWLSSEAFVQLCEQAEAEHADVAAAARARVPVQPLEAHATIYVPCVVCSQLMTRKNYGSSSGVIIDLCREHGVWLDQRELEKILVFIRAGGLQRERQREIERLKEEQRKLQAAARDARGLGAPPDDSWAFGRRRGYGNPALFDWTVDALTRLLT